MTDPNRQLRRNRVPRDQAFFEWIAGHPLVALLLVAAVTVALGSQLPKLRLDPDTEAFVPIDHPVRTEWRQTKQRFDLGKDIFVALKADGPRGVFTPEILRGIRDLTDAIEKLDTVMDGDVRSLANSDAIVGTEEGLIVEPFFEEPPATLAQAQEVRRKVFANDVFLDRLVSRDGSIAVIIVQAHDAYDPDSPYPHPVEVYQDVAKLVSRMKIPGTTAYLAGSTSVEAVFGRQMEADLAHLIPLSLMVVVVVLYLCFRTGSLARLGIRAAVVFALVLGISLWGGKEVSLAATACAAV
ncbi:MAG: hypothetical protein D6760_07465, partial [Deltaproteobacteria bacterium]